MLVFSRKCRESFLLDVGGLRARILIAEVRGQSVQVGIEAPPEIKVLRSELEGRPARTGSPNHGPQSQNR